MLHAGNDTTASRGRGPTPPLVRLALAVGPVMAAAALGSAITTPNIPTWYAGLAKPGFTPPNWVFGPAWAALYLAMAVAIWRILARPREDPRRGPALAVFFLQLALNAAWSWAFFGLHSPVAGLVVILPLLALILETIRRFRPLDGVAAALLVPYALWVAYATALNVGIWRLNG